MMVPRSVQDCGLGILTSDFEFHCEKPRIPRANDGIFETCTKKRHQTK